MSRPGRIPPHGTEARYKGAPLREGCRCAECRRAANLARLKRTVRNARGDTCRVPAEPIRAHVQTCLDSGMSKDLIGRLSGVRPTSIAFLLTKGRPLCSRKNAERLLRVRPGSTDELSWLDSIGAIRRVRALYVRGHSSNRLATITGLSRDAILDIATGTYASVTHKTDRAIAAAYRQLAHTEGSSTRTKNWAAAQLWDPPAAWDDDSIDDPNAQPDITGHCGTTKGYFTHQMENLAICARCRAAIDQWKAEHAHLDPPVRNGLFLTERAAAMGRSKALAEDWEELRLQGYTLNGAAERLGVTPSQLGKALSRAYDEAA